MLTPGFTDYNKRVLYQVYDVTSSIAKGSNTLGAVLGDGWFGSGLTWVGEHFFTGPDRLRAQLELVYKDGTRGTISSDETWKASHLQFCIPKFTTERITTLASNSPAGITPASTP